MAEPGRRRPVRPRAQRRRLLLVGYSMGGAIVLNFLEHSPLAGRVVGGVVLDSPMTDFGRAVGHGASGQTLPRVGLPLLQSLTDVSRQLERANLVYGAFAIVGVLLSWLYLSAQVLLYAAEVNVVLARRLWPRSLLQSPLTGPDQEVLAALAQTEARLPEETIEVRFSSEVNGDDDPPRPGG